MKSWHSLNEWDHTGLFLLVCPLRINEFFLSHIYNESWLLIIFFNFRALSYAWPFLCKINVLMDFDKFWLHIALSVEAESLKLLILWHGKNVYGLKIFWASWRKKLYTTSGYDYSVGLYHIAMCITSSLFRKDTLTSWLIDWFNTFKEDDLEQNQVLKRPIDYFVTWKDCRLLYTCKFYIFL